MAAFYLNNEKTKRELNVYNSIKTRFYYERGKEHPLFLLLIFKLIALKIEATLSKAKSIKQTKKNIFHAYSGNGPLDFYHSFQSHLFCGQIAHIPSSSRGIEKKLYYPVTLLKQLAGSE